MELSKTSLNSTEEYESQHFTLTIGRVFATVTIMIIQEQKGRFRKDFIF